MTRSESALAVLVGAPPTCHLVYRGPIFGPLCDFLRCVQTVNMADLSELYKKLAQSVKDVDDEAILKVASESEYGLGSPVPPLFCSVAIFSLMTWARGIEYHVEYIAASHNHIERIKLRFCSQGCPPISCSRQPRPATRPGDRLRRCAKMQGDCDDTLLDYWSRPA